jgi:hypothetical protein
MRTAARLFIYEKPISQLVPLSRFFIAFRPTLAVWTNSNWRNLHDDRPSTSLTKPLVFGLVAASTLVLLLLIGVASENAAPIIAQLNTESPATSGSQNP